jgi:hypothetical protein
LSGRLVQLLSRFYAAFQLGSGRVISIQSQEQLGKLNAPEQVLGVGVNVLGQVEAGQAVITELQINGGEA